MAKKQSAGLLIYRKKDTGLEVLLAHNGGPWFKNKDLGFWTIPKGEYEDSENPKQAAGREFSEELSLQVPAGEWLQLGSVEQKNNKTVKAWAIEGDLDPAQAKSNTVKAEWPPRSGKISEWPEIDRVEWFNLTQAAKKINSAQVEFLERLAQHLGEEFTPEAQASQQELL